MILCIDDDPELLELVCQSLQDPEIIVIGAPTAESAMAMCGAGSVDVLVTDLGLPRHSGVHVIAALRARYPRLPVIVLSGYSSGEMRESALSLDVSAYLVKPVDIFELRRVVYSFLAQDGMPPPSDT